MMKADPLRLPVSVLGVPFDNNSSFLKGAALAPAHIRAAFYSDSANLCAENGLDLGETAGWKFAGDLDFDNQTNSHQVIQEGIDRLLAAGQRVITLGGDHSITFPAVETYARYFPNLTILHLDAHPDLYDELDGNRWSHACPFARIMEAGLVQRLVQVGIRTATPHQRRQAERFKVETVFMRDWKPGFLPDLSSPVYLSLDLDVLDPAFMPGVAHHEPGGMNTRDVIGLIQGLAFPLAGADMVELNPARDFQEVSAMTTAKLLKEILANMLQ